MKKSVKTKKQGAWASSYDDIDDNVMYIKIDDDIVRLRLLVCAR